MLNLALLAVMLVQRFVVGHVQHSRSDLRAENRGQLLRRRIGVFDGVVKDRCAEDHHIGDATLVRQHVGQRDRMVDIRRRIGILATLGAVLVSGEGHCLQKHTDGV